MNGYGKGVDVVIAADQLDLSCLSQIQMCTFDKHCQGKACEFTDCPVERGWGPFERGNFFDVPVGYLGPLTSQPIIRLHN